VALTPEQVEDRLKALEARNLKLEKDLRAGRIDNRIPLLATGFDLEDAIFPPAVRVTMSGAQTIGNNAFASLTFNTEDFDTDTMHSTASNTNRITVNTAGIYLIIGSAEWATIAAGRRITRLRVNGATEIATGETGSAAGGSEFPCTTVATLYKMEKADWVEVRVFQSRGGDLDVRSQLTFFTAIWQAPLP
jgi:hypothetical protein